MSLFAFLMFPIKILVGITIIILIIAWISESIDKKKVENKDQ